MNEIKDFYGRTLNIGDKVVLGKDWARDCDFLVIGIVEDIKYYPIKTIAKIKVTNIGRCNYGLDTAMKGKDRYISYVIPRLHNNILII